MATPTNLKELAEQQLAAWSADKAATQSVLQAAQSALTDGSSALQVATSDHKARTDGIEALRKQLAKIATPADAAPLLAALETNIIAQRSAVATMLSSEVNVAQARVDMEGTRERLRLAGAAIGVAQGKVRTEQTAQTKREAAKTAITQAPFSTLATRATNLLASQAFTVARQRVETDFPQALRDRARERRQLAADQMARAVRMKSDIEALIDAHYSARGSAADKIAAQERALSTAEARLYEYIARASARYDAAEAALKRIGSPDNPPLSAEEHVAIDDTALLAGRAAAALAEHERDAALDRVRQAQAAFDLESLKVFATSGADGVSAALADNTSVLAKAKADLDTATADWTQKETAYDSAMRQVMNQWEAAVPDSAWRDLADFDAAEATLTELQQNPADLATAVTSAEANLLAAWLSVDNDARLLREYASALTVRSGASDVAMAVSERARFGSLRGDG